MRLLAALAAQVPLAAGGAVTTPYIVLFAVGFAVGAWGHVAKLRILIALGIALIVAALVLWQLDVSGDSSRYLPPG